MSESKSHEPEPSTSSPWIDVSVPLHSGMVHWPRDPAVSIERVRDIAEGASANVSLLTFGSHTGTHMDAPLHFLPNGVGIDLVPLTATIGPARVIQVHDPTTVTAAELRPHRIRRGERLLLRTRNSDLWKLGAFAEDFVSLSLDAVELLVDRRVRALGVDYLSISGFRSGQGAALHRPLLEAGICVIEGLDLSAAPPGRYDLVCLPLRIRGGDGAPCRAILRPRAAHRRT